MTPDRPSICDLCKYYVPGVDPSNARGKPVCRAFPEGIPSEILDGGYDHRQPLGNESILFKKADDVADEEVVAWEQEVLEAEKADLIGLIERTDT